MYSSVSGPDSYLPGPTSRTALRGLPRWGRRGWGRSIWAAHSACTRRCASICPYCQGWGSLQRPCLCRSGSAAAPRGCSGRRPAAPAAPPAAGGRAWAGRRAACCRPGTAGRLPKPATLRDKGWEGGAGVSKRCVPWSLAAARIQSWLSGGFGSRFSLSCRISISLILIVYFSSACTLMWKYFYFHLRSIFVVLLKAWIK